MPLIFLIGGLGLGSFFGSQADDVIEDWTGQKGGIPWLFLGLAFVVWWYFIRRKRG